MSNIFDLFKKIEKGNENVRANITHMVVGLGNPGEKYQRTRHNIGFMTLDYISYKLGIKINRSKFKALVSDVDIDGKRVLLMKPQTYMNLSGQAVSSLMHFYDIPVEDLIVCHDDLDLPVGKLRLRRQGSAGGQKGMASIIDHLGTSKIDRIRIGISKDKNIETKDYVLGKFSKDDRKILDEVLDKGADALLYALDHDFDLVMTKFN